MKIFKRSYDFYDLPEEERKAMVGESFMVNGPYGSSSPYEHRGFVIQPDIYFPIQLSEHGQHLNYGTRQGVLNVIGIRPFYEKSSQYPNTWFRVACFSPDDLDLDLNFENSPTEELRNKVIDLIREMPKDEVEYRECLEFIQSYFGGEIDG